MNAQIIAPSGVLDETSLKAVEERLAEIIGDGPFVIYTDGYSQYQTKIWRMASGLTAELTCVSGSIMCKPADSGTLVLVAELPAKYNFTGDQLELRDLLSTVVIAPLRLPETLGEVDRPTLDKQYALTEDTIGMIAAELHRRLVDHDVMYATTSTFGDLTDMERQQISGVRVCGQRLFIELGNPDFWAHSYAAVATKGSISHGTVTMVTFKTNGSIAFLVQHSDGSKRYHVMYAL